MLKRLISGFLIMALAIPVLPAIAFAGIEIGDSLKMFGDFRFRSEYTFINFESGNSSESDTRTRQRLRLRWGLKYKITDDLSFGARLATGTGSFNSPHMTFETSNTGKNDDYGLDRAFFEYKFIDSGVLIVGKQGYPFWSQSDIMWDKDAQLEGFTTAYTASMGDAGSITGALAYYVIDENGWEKDVFDNDSMMVWQLVHKGKFGDAKTVVQVSGFHMTDGDDDGDFVPTGTTSSDTEPAFYEVSGQVKLPLGSFKLLVGADYAVSDWTETGDDHNQGFVVQARVKKDKWGVRYYYYNVEEAAVPFYGDTPLTQDNFGTSNASALTGFEGHRIQLDYKFLKNVKADLRVYLQEGKSDNRFTALAEWPSREINRVQFNLNMKF